MSYTAVMFDLDGTLLDTLADIAAGGNHVLASYGLPPRPVADYRYLAGQGAPWLVAEALGPQHTAWHEQGVQRFKKYQLAHGLDQTRPYDGIPQMLDGLTQRGLPLAVLSNKPHTATQEAVRLRLGNWQFADVRGHMPDGPLKPDPAGALAIADALHIPAAQWLYLGDTKVDMATARAAGMLAVGCLWGFRQEEELRAAGADAIVRHPLEVLAIIDAASARPARHSR